MKLLKKENEQISTFLTFALVPISGFAMDMYVPSFPHMASDLSTSGSNIKLTLTIFLISYGLSQLFVGSILDSYGRYKSNLIALFIFCVSCLAVTVTDNIFLILILRFIQGISIAFVVVCKRAFIIDVFTGDKRIHYTSMLTVVWSTAPIIAPFLGGFLQDSFNWRANFYFLAVYGFIIFLLELKYSGETLKIRKVFNLQNIFDSYKHLLRTKDFSGGILILGLSHSMVLVFIVSIPFIVEHQYHLSPLFSGYCALTSGVAIFLGGFLSKKLINRNKYKKLQVANILQLSMAVIMLVTAGYFHQLWMTMVLVFIIHFWQGFSYNTYFTYALTSQPKYAATASGLASGGSSVVASAGSYGVIYLINIDSQWALGLSYLIFIVIVQGLILGLKKSLN